MRYFRCIEDDKIYTEEELKKDFEILSKTYSEYDGITFGQYLNNCMTRNNGSIEEVYPFHVDYFVECFDRTLTVDGFSTLSALQILHILDRRYDQWNDLEVCPEAVFYCCEEWMLEGLDELGICYTPTYSDDN